MCSNDSLKLATLNAINDEGDDLRSLYATFIWVFSFPIL
jgi:hypothetical protein